MTSYEKTKAPTVGAAGALTKTKKQRKFNDKSTATAAQINKALELLRIRQRHTYEFRKLGISHPAARVMDLISMGCVITSSRITAVDSEGYLHSNVGLYELVSEPVAGEVPQ